MSIPVACCTLPPVQSSYEPQGHIIKIGDLDVYETGDSPNPHTVLILAYDIFGFHNVTKQVADKLAVNGYRVVMPDFFKGQPIPLEAFPPEGTFVIRKWLHIGWNMLKMNKLLRAHLAQASTSNAFLLQLIQHYKQTHHVHQFGILGFCWGAKVCIEALADLEDIKAGAVIHPSMWKVSDAERIKKPMLLLPTKDDSDMTSFYEILKKNLGEENCGHRRFNEVHHGFCSARADLSNELNRQMVDEALGLMHNFFNKHIAQSKF